MNYVIDTSVLAKVFLAEPEQDRVAGLIQACVQGGAALLAPSLLLYEINNALVSNGVRGTEYGEAVARLMRWVRAGVISISEPNEELL